MKNLFFLTTLCLVLSISNVFGQATNKFPSNTEDFIKQLKEYMTASNQEELVTIYNAFESEFRQGVYEDPDMEMIIKTSNLMLDQKMKAKPYFCHYLKGVTTIKKNECTVNQFKSWHQVLDGILENMEGRKVKPYRDFLEFSYGFFENNALRSSKTGISWLAFTGNATMVYKDNEPQLELKEADLVCIRKKDRIKIQETAGTYYPLQKKWKGDGGEVKWAKEGMEKVYCEFSEYVIDVTKGLYKVKNAKLYYPYLFPLGPVEGTFENKLLAKNKMTKGSYPRFESNQKVLEIDNLGDGIEYVGGFRLQGNKMYGFGDKNEKATINVLNKQNKVALKAAANLFKIERGEKISGEQVAMVMYVGNDSIYHPSVNLNFSVDGKSLSLKRGDRGSDSNPFFSSHHQMNIDADKIKWNIEENDILINEKKIKTGSLNKRVVFESLHYFDVQDYRRQQNVADYNPISTLKNLTLKESSREIKASLLAKTLNPNFDVSSIERLLWDLVSKGYILYDKEEGLVTVKDKIIHYADASQNKVDYDVLKITSDSEETNAVVDMESNKMLVKDVNILEFSNERKVAASPHKGQIVLGTNRSIDFDGKLFAAFSSFEGKDFNFDYDKFHVNMDSVRYFDLYVQDGTTDKNGEPNAYSIASRIEHANGYLLIDAPKNKSGREDIPMFPSFESKGKSNVFYDTDETQKGVYSRDSFYFELDPFSFNHLDAFVKEDLHFDGKMISADIFPEFKETLLLQEDESLGFTTTTPAEGYDLYQGKGKYIGDVGVSNQGMLGKGNVSYLWASINSEDIIFKPKQLLSSAQEFVLTEDRAKGVPQIAGENVKINWHPYKDSMYIKATEKPFELFQSGKHNVHDLLILTPGGLKGRGVFNWEFGNINSELFSFGSNSMETDTADMSIKAKGVEHLALDTKNVFARLDFDAETGYVKANNKSTITTLPYNKYQTSLNEYDWNIKDENITFKTEENKKGAFLSIDPKRDSLYFEGETAFYDLKTNELQVGGVPFIEVADAYVYPNEGNVEIRPGGLIPTLEEAKILANTKNKYHVINRASVDVIGKNEYKASGFYEYNIGNRTQEIKFSNIRGGRVGKGKKEMKKIVTLATGEIGEDENFYIDAKTKYKGKVELTADEANLQLSGFAKLDAVKLPKANWFSIKSKGDKNNLEISYDQPKDFYGQPVRAGLFVSKETGSLYTRTMESLNFRKDLPIFDARGLFKYNKENDQFLFGDSIKIVSNVRQGKLLTFSDKDGKIKMEGEFNVGPKIAEMNVKAYGTTETTVDASADEMVLNMMTAINMYFPKDIMSILSTDFVANGFDARTVLYRPYELYENPLAEIITDSKALAMEIANMKSTGSFTLPEKENTYAFFFSKMPMVWNAEYRSFLSKENKIGLGSINGVMYHKMVEGYVEMKMSKDSDRRLYIYLKSPGGDFYFFDYKLGILSVVSSNETFNQAVTGMKKKQKTKKMADGELFEIVLGEMGKAKMFVQRVKAGR